MSEISSEVIILFDKIIRALVFLKDSDRDEVLDWLTTPNPSLPLNGQTPAAYMGFGEDINAPLRELLENADPEKMQKIYDRIQAHVREKKGEQ